MDRPERNVLLFRRYVTSNTVVNDTDYLYQNEYEIEKYNNRMEKDE